MDDQICYHCFISGRVQGVFFRAETRKQALRLNITGWVRNLADGRVEVLACGRPEDLDKLLVWLESGPPLAEVSGVSREAMSFHRYPGFDIK